MQMRTGVRVCARVPMRRGLQILQLRHRVQMQPKLQVRAAGKMNQRTSPGPASADPGLALKRGN